jgi:hypothetical protein
VLVLLVAVPVQADLLGDFINFLTGGSSPDNTVLSLSSFTGGPGMFSSSGATLNPPDMNWINLSPDILGTSGSMNITWNFTTWNRNLYPSCYIRILSQYDLIELGRVKMVDISSLNKTGTRQIAYSGFPSGIYYLHLNCAALNWENNISGFTDSVSLDIVPIVINSTVTTNTARNVGIREAQLYTSCEWRNGIACNQYNWTNKACRDAPINCPEWQYEAAQGRSWNQSLGVPI